MTLREGNIVTKRASQLRNARRSVDKKCITKLPILQYYGTIRRAAIHLPEIKYIYLCLTTKLHGI